MLSIFCGWSPWKNHARTNSLIDRVTARVQNAVRRRVSGQLNSMGVHEARGYIRARATAAIRREMGIVLAEAANLRSLDSQRISVAVRNRVVRRLLLENLRRIEPNHTRQRRAA